MSDLTLGKIDALGDFFTNEVFDVQFVTLPTGFTGITAEDINLRCQQFTVPDTKVNYLTVNHRTFTKSQPTHRENYQTFGMSMVETMTPKTLPFLRDWMNRCAVKGTNFVYPPSQRQCEILVYHKRNDKTIGYVYNLKHVQIEEKGTTELGGDSVNAIIPQLNLNSNLVLEGPDIKSLK